MSRIVPYPLFTLSLVGLWLLLNQSVSPGQILLGFAVALLAAWSLTALDLQLPRVTAVGAVLRLMGLVAVDIARSNIAVARIILGLAGRRGQPAFLEIPLDTRNPYALAALACIITATPGTLWVNHDATKSLLLLHVLDLVDEEEWLRTIKGRYERLLMEIFE
jgi:multicomponent K+:H+ antiporter subunit E